MIITINEEDIIRVIMRVVKDKGLGSDRILNRILKAAEK